MKKEIKYLGQITLQQFIDRVSEIAESDDPRLVFSIDYQDCFYESDLPSVQVDIYDE